MTISLFSVRGCGAMRCAPSAFRRRTTLSLTLALLLLALLPHPAHAHAILVRSTPADGATLDTAPHEIRLWFDEPVSDRFSNVRLFDATNQPVGGILLGADPSDPHLIVVTLPALPDGVYTVLWKVFSEADGHYSQGLYVLGIGATVQMDSDSSRTTPSTAAPAWRETLLRWANYGALMALLGALAMLRLTATRSPTADTTVSLLDQAEFRRRLLDWSIVAALFLLLAGLGLLLDQALTLQGTTPGNPPVATLAGQLVIGTRWGILWSVRHGLLLGLLCLLWHFRTAYSMRAQSVSPATLYGMAGALLLIGILLTQAGTGHANGVTRGALLATSNAALHMAAAGIWIGGLPAICVAVSPLLWKQRATALALLRYNLGPFGWWAATSVGLLFATGFYSVGQQVASPDALLTTWYGRTLLVKVGVVLTVGALGLLNTLLVHPRLAAPLARHLQRPSGWTPLSMRHLPLLVGGEVLLGVLVLLATGLLTAAAPPRGIAYTLTPADVPSALSRNVDDLVITLGVKPNRPGQNVFNLFAATSLRPPPAEIVRVLVRFRYLDEEAGQVTAIAEAVEPGRYLISGNYLSLAGRWEIEVVTRRAGMEDSVAKFLWMVAPPGGVDAAIYSKHPLYISMTWMAVAILLLLGMSLIGGRLYRRLPQTQAEQPAGV